MNTKSVLALSLGLVMMLAGCAAPPRTESNVATANTSTTQKLGTLWGEDISSSVVSVNATRLHSNPNRVVTIYYQGGKPDAPAPINRVSLAAIEMQVLDDSGNSMKMSPIRDSGYRLAAKEGERYQLYFYNRSRSTAYEVVVTVDGLDVLSGQTGSLSHPGYLIRPNTSMTIDGFRKSSSAVAAFRFAKPHESYAANSMSGEIGNVGVIGAAVFEMAHEKLPDCQPQAFPADSRYASPPCQKK